MIQRVLGSIAWTIAACTVIGCGGATDLPAAQSSLSATDRALTVQLASASDDHAPAIHAALAEHASPECLEAVRAGEVVKGMAAADVLRSWGEPGTARRPQVTLGHLEQWVYKLPGLPALELWLEDGCARSVIYGVTGTVPNVPSGRYGWLKRWPTTDQLRDSHW